MRTLSKALVDLGILK